jgi:hypothetical protein
MLICREDILAVLIRANVKNGINRSGRGKIEL